MIITISTILDGLEVVLAMEGVQFELFDQLWSGLFMHV